MESLAEIAGPVWASFQQKFGESHGDFLAILLGNINVHNYSENSDSATQTERVRERVMVEDWVVVSTEEVMDVKSGQLKKDTIQNLFEDRNNVFVGLLKFKNRSPVDLSFLDRRMMYAISESCSWGKPDPRLFLLVVKDVTPTTLSMRYSVMTYLLQSQKKCYQEPWSGKIPLVIPNLGTDQRVEYMHGGGGGSKALSEMVEEVEFLEDCNSRTDKTFGAVATKFEAEMDQRGRKVSCLEKMKVDSEKELARVSLELEEKLEVCQEMKVIEGLQGDLATALSIIRDGLGGLKQTINESPDIFDDPNVTGDMEMNDSEVLNQSYR